jgi:hypothetical protein
VKSNIRLLLPPDGAFIAVVAREAARSFALAKGVEEFLDKKDLG